MSDALEVFGQHLAYRRVDPLLCKHLSNYGRGVGEVRWCERRTMASIRDVVLQTKLILVTVVIGVDDDDGKMAEYTWYDHGELQIDSC